MSAYALVTLRLANGEVVGPMNVQGAGGAIPSGPNARYVIANLIARAYHGKALGCYEPEPGHCLMMRINVGAHESPRVVDLRGAVVIDVR